MGADQKPDHCSARFVMMLSTIAIVFAIVFLVVGVTTVYKGKATQTFTFAVSILVAFVPEGLPSTVTLLYVYCVSSFLCYSKCSGCLSPQSAWLPKMCWSKIYKALRLWVRLGRSPINVISSDNFSGSVG
jgi:uncharacterized membrane protein YozB (DUF420 family)